LETGLNFARNILLFVTLLARITLPPDSATAEAIPLTSTAVPYFHIGSSDNSAGRLTFLGGLEIESENKNFGGLSGLRFSADGTRLFSVSDHGYWFTAEIARDEKQVIAKLGNGILSCLCRTDGTPYGSKHWSDAEGVEITDKKAYVVFERLNRINVYDLKADFRIGPPAQATASFKKLNIDYAQGLEALALAPATSPLAGKFVAISEKSLDAKGNNRAFIADAKTVEEFSVIRSGDYSITDATFMPEGDLLVLERRFGLSIGIGIRIRQISGVVLKPGALVDGEVLMEAGLSSRIDNMEGITIWQTPEGETRIAILSDDNYSRLQRTLLLEFKLNQ